MLSVYSPGSVHLLILKTSQMKSAKYPEDLLAGMGVIRVIVKSLMRETDAGKCLGRLRPTGTPHCPIERTHPQLSPRRRHCKRVYPECRRCRRPYTIGS